MQIRFTKYFVRSYNKAPASIRAAFDKQLTFLVDDLRHPSLRAKKFTTAYWQGRITRDWRFYFAIEGDVYILVDIVAHPK